MSDGAADARWLDTRSAAVACAELGLAVFQVHEIRADGRCGCGDRGCACVGKHPVGSGWRRSVASRQFAEREWTRFPNRGLALKTGATSGCFAIDVDPRHGGSASLAKLVDAHGKLPVTWTARTGGGGLHILFAWPADVEVRNSTGKFAAGIDVRGNGGFIVLAPSAHISGNRYRWIYPPGEPPQPCPSWLLELIGNGGPSPRTRARAPTAMVPAGMRHSAVVSLLGVMRRWGACEEVLDAAAVAFFQHQCLDDDPNRPLSMAHARRQAADIAKRY